MKAGPVTYLERSHSALALTYWTHALCCLCNLANPRWMLCVVAAPVCSLGIDRCEVANDSCVHGERGS
jgi:hypothetical protein